MSQHSSVRSEWGLSCPQCRSDAHLEVQLATLARLTAEGTCEFGDGLSDSDSYMRCDACGFDGWVSQFETEVLS